MTRDCQLFPLTVPTFIKQLQTIVCVLLRSRKILYILVAPKTLCNSVTGSHGLVIPTSLVLFVICSTA